MLILTNARRYLIISTIRQGHFGVVQQTYLSRYTIPRCKVTLDCRNCESSVPPVVRLPEPNRINRCTNFSLPVSLMRFLTRCHRYIYKLTVWTRVSLTNKTYKLISLGAHMCAATHKFIRRWLPELCNEI